MKARFRGWFGEIKTALKLWYSLNKKEYQRYHNLILPSNNGTTQIDHLIISVYGLFIVETKNRAGWIFGSKDESTWTQTLFQNKFTFQNPLHQTFRQKKVLIELLNVKESCVFRIIYFNGNCEFKTVLPKNVIKSRIGKYIKDFKKVILTSNDLDRIKSILDQHISESNLKGKDHLKSLKERHNSKTICPNCGAALVTKTTRKGKLKGVQFLGCENYPKCRFSKSL